MGLWGLLRRSLSRLAGGTREQYQSGHNRSWPDPRLGEEMGERLKESLVGVVSIPMYNAVTVWELVDVNAAPIGER